MRLIYPAVSLFALTIMAVAPTGVAKVTHAKTVAKAPQKPAANPAVTGLNADGALHMPVLADAPTDDFERVAWCHGVLSGDMELAELINPVLPTDDQLQLIGTSYLRAYEAALTLSGKGKSAAEHKKAEDARDFGYNEWAAARKAPLKDAAGLYVNWQLPGECEKAAVRLSGHPNLFAEMATDDEAAAIQAVMTSGGPHDYDEKPKPVLTAQTAPVDGGPVAANTLGQRVDIDAALPKIQKPTPPATDDKPKDDKRHWSDGLAYRLGWSNTPKEDRK
ncbi:MAG TPA: hypothetical protein VN042_00770 [Asticcacaulis sp.]|nr:hypothetical protein [Asticcacaulis sp.]